MIRCGIICLSFLLSWQINIALDDRLLFIGGLESTLVWEGSCVKTGESVKVAWVDYIFGNFRFNPGVISVCNTLVLEVSKVEGGTKGLSPD